MADDKNPQDPADNAEDALTPEGQREIRERVTRLVFDGDDSRYNEFVEALANATPDGVWVILRGSAITGHKWKSDEPFDADGPGTSDMDVTFVGGDMVMLFNEFHIPGIHSVPFGEDHPFAAPALGDLRERLCRMAKRQVNIQATTSIVQSVRDATMDQPYLVMVDKRETEKQTE
jgi:hypothetical protein